MGKKYDFAGWATRANIPCSDGRMIMRDAFKDQDGEEVPLVWNHNHDVPQTILGKALLHSQDGDMYAYCSFNDTESGKDAKIIVEHGDVKSLSILANRLKEKSGHVIHGIIREVSLVLAGANPGARIENVLAHSEDGTVDAVIYNDEYITLNIDDSGLSHSEDEKKTEDDEKKNEVENENEAKKVFDTLTDEQKKAVYAILGSLDDSDEEEEESEVKHSDDEESESDKTVQDVFDTLTDEQKDVVYEMAGFILENKKELLHADDENDEGNETVKEIIESMTDKQRDAMAYVIAQVMDSEGDEKNSEDEIVKHSNEEEDTMKQNVFDREKEIDSQDTLCHADGMKIVEMAKANGGNSLRAAMRVFAEDNNKTLAHADGDNDLGFKDIGQLFPEYSLVNPGAPEKIAKDTGWVGKVLTKVRKSPKNRLKVRFTDARDTENRRAQGYKKGTRKEYMGNLELLKRTVDPITIYNLDHLDRDDVLDITDFDIINYMYQDQDLNLRTELARQILIGDGRNGDVSDPESSKAIDPTKIIPVWTDDDLFTIHTIVDFDKMKNELQGDDTALYFGENYIYAEAILQSMLYARENYKGSGSPDFYCTPHLVNVMLLARDRNGRRIYDNRNDLVAAMNIGELVTVEHFADKTRTVVVNGVQQTRRLLGILVNLNDYTVGATRGSEITHFTDFDIHFNQHESLVETRSCGMLTKPFSAIVLEEIVNPQ